MPESKLNSKLDTNSTLLRTLVVAMFLHSAVFASAALEKVFAPKEDVESMIYLDAVGDGHTRKIAKREYVPEQVAAKVEDIAEVEEESESENTSESQIPEEGNSEAADASKTGVSTGEAGGPGEQSLAATYKQSIHSLIESQLKYPGVSKSLGETGTVHVRFRVERDGKITGIELARPCAFERLNQAALTTLARLERVAAIPEALAQQTMDLVMPFEFDLRSAN